MAEVMATAVYLINISPTKAVWNVTLYEAWYESKLAANHLCILLCFMEEENWIKKQRNIYL